MRKVIQTVLLAFLVTWTVAGFAWTTRIERFVTHTVQVGDTLDKLARIYGTTKRKIIAKNGVSKTRKLIMGEKLVIPVNGYKEKLII